MKFHGTRFAVSTGVAVIIAAFAFSPVATAAGTETPRTLTVRGAGSASAPPDFAVVRSGVVTEAKTPSEAIAANSGEVEKMMAALKRFGIADKDLQTSQFQLNPQYDRRGSNRSNPLITGYRVTNQVTVRLREIGNLGNLLDQLVKAGANQLGGVSFSVAEPKKMLEDARRKAVADAKGLAKLYAAELGVTVGRVLRFTESGRTDPRPERFLARAASNSINVPVAPGESTVSVQISVVFEIE